MHKNNILQGKKILDTGTSRCLYNVPMTGCLIHFVLDLGIIEQGFFLNNHGYTVVPTYIFEWAIHPSTYIVHFLIQPDFSKQETKVILESRSIPSFIL